MREHYFEDTRVFDHPLIEIMSRLRRSATAFTAANTDAVFR